MVDPDRAADRDAASGPADPPAGAVLDDELWRSELAARFKGLAATPTPGTGATIRGRLSSVGLDDISVHQVSGHGQVLHRTQQAVRREPSDLLKVCLMVQGAATLAQGGVEVDVRPGQFVLYDTARPYRLINHGAWQVSVMTVPRHGLSVASGELGRLMERPVQADAGAGQVFANYLASLVAMPDSPPTAVAQHFRSAGLALLSGALTGSLAEASEVGPQIVTDQILGWIHDHLDDPEVSIDLLAREIHVSTRTVQRLLSARDETFSSLVRSGRLEAIRRDLADRSQRHRPIMAIAARWGVADQSWLSRSFRSAYQVSPSEFRRQVAAADGWS